MALFGTVELGGTKTDIAVGTSPEDLSPPHRVATSDPMATLDQVVGVLESHEIVALGVASFGPIDVDRDSAAYGTILSTPKDGWSGYPVLEHLARHLDVPIVVESDVNGAALGEGRWGASRGLSDHAYVTVGTGIGAGFVAGGRLFAGKGHPEAGHVRVDRHPDDDYEGRCPFHNDCWEGMTAGPALEARFGQPENWPAPEARNLAAHYIARGLTNLFYTVRPQRIVLGGGVTNISGLHDAVRAEMAPLVGDYPEHLSMSELIVSPGLGDRSGLAGGLVLAESAASSTG